MLLEDRAALLPVGGYMCSVTGLSPERIMEFVAMDIEEEGALEKECVECGAYEPYPGHCGCVEYAELLAQSSWVSPRCMVFGGANWLFGADGEISEIRVRPSYPYSNGYCWLLCFEEDVREKILDEVDAPPEMSIPQLTHLSRDYAYGTDRLELTRVAEGRYHFTLASESSRTGRTYVEWLAEIHSPGGVHSRAKDGLFGGYKEWNPRGNHGRYENMRWMNVGAFSKFAILALGSLFSKQATRESLLTDLNACQGFGLVSADERFPKIGSYVALSEAGWGAVVTQLVGALQYKDRSKDQKAKAGVDEAGVEREIDYNDSLATFGKALSSLLSKCYDVPGVYNREFFESANSLTWEGDDDSVTPVYKRWDARVEAVLQMPFLTSSSLMRAMNVWWGLNPNLAAHRSQMVEVLHQAFELAPPVDRSTAFAEDGKQWVMSVYRDWPSKLAGVFLAAGHVDGTKDEKFKMGQRVEITGVKNDGNDAKQLYVKTLEKIQNQLARREGVFFGDEIEALFGLSK